MFYLLLISIAYIAGILFFDKVDDISIYAYVSSTFFIIGLIEYKIKRSKILITLSLLIVSFFIGAYWYKISLPKPENNDLKYYAPQESIKLEALIINEPKKDENKISFEIKSELVLEPYISLSAGRAIVNIYQTDLDLQYGDRVEIYGNLDLPPKSFNPKGFSYQKYLNQQGIFSFIIAEKIDILEKNTKNDFNSFIINTRKNLLSNLYKTLPKDSANVVGSLVFGAKATPVSKEIRDDFTNLGLAHVLAASGMQISLIISTGLILIRFSKINRLLGINLIIGIVIFYMFLTGMPPSILRAGLLNIIILLIQYKRESPDTYKLLFIISFLILIFSPLTLFDIGFQFSVLATLGLLYISKPLEDKLTFLPTFLSSIVAMIISAQIMVLPLQIYHFGQLSYLFLPANLITVLFVDLITYLSIISIILGFILPFISSFLGLIIYYILTLFISIVDYLSLLPFSISYIKKPEVIFVIFSYTLIVFITEILRENIIKFSLFKQNKFIFLISAQLFLLGIVSYTEFNKMYDLSITFINVKQGDSTLIETPEKKNILIDCGSAYNFTKNDKEIKFNASEKYIIPYLRHNGITTIDKLIITHPDLDHIGGCELLLDNFNVLEVWDSGQKDDSEQYNNLLKKITEKEIPLKVVNYNDSYQEKDLNLRVINKIEPDNLDIDSYNNNNAIALRLDYDNNSFLFMSDLEKESEFKLLDENINTQVLKVGHHGSLTSSTDDFLLMSRPQYSVISAGKNNRYRHPRKEIIERLEYIGSKIYRTDQDGGIIFKSNGNELNVNISE